MAMNEAGAFDCPQCDKIFSHKSNLKIHERIHTGAKPFSCSQCDYKCSQSNNMRIHERIHSGEKRFTCVKTCDKSFASAQNLRKHMLKCLDQRGSSPGSFLQEIKTEPHY